MPSQEDLERESTKDPQTPEQLQRESELKALLQDADQRRRALLVDQVKSDLEQAIANRQLLTGDYPDHEPCRLPYIAAAVQLPAAVSLNVVLFRIRRIQDYLQGFSQSY